MAVTVSTVEILAPGSHADELLVPKAGENDGDKNPNNVAGGLKA
jgi:hypothetical protein